MRRLLEAFEEGLGELFFLWRFWEIILEVLEGDEREVVGMKFVNLCLKGSKKTIWCANTKKGRIFIL
jgi:hypothetical protein